MLFADERREFLLVLLDEIAEPIQDPRTPKRRRGPPRRKCGDRRLHGGVDVRGIGKRHGPDDVSGGGIGDHAVTAAMRRAFLAVDPQRHSCDGPRR